MPRDRIRESYIPACAILLKLYFQTCGRQSLVQRGKKEVPQAQCGDLNRRSAEGP